MTTSTSQHCYFNIMPVKWLGQLAPEKYSINVIQSSPVLHSSQDHCPCVFGKEGGCIKSDPSTLFHTASFLSCSLSQLARAAKRKHQRLSGLNKRHVFLKILEAGEPQSKMLTDSILGELPLCYSFPFTVCSHTFPRCAYVEGYGDRDKEVSSLSHKDTNPNTKAPLSWSNLIPSQRPTSYTITLGLGLQHESFGGTVLSGAHPKSYPDRSSPLCEGCSLSRQISLAQVENYPDPPCV